MAVVVERYLEHFDYNFSSIKDEMYSQIPTEYSQFMRVENTTRPFEKRSYIGGLGIPVRNRDLEAIPFVEAPQGPTAYFIPVNYRLGYQIERQVIEDELWNLLGNRPRSMLYGTAILMDMTGADILNNGYTSQSYDMGFTSGSTEPLFSATHAREDGGTAWSNLVATDLPITVETVFQEIADLLYNMVDSRGLPIAYNGTINLYVPTINATLWKQAVEVIKSVMNPNTADNKINALAQTFKLNLVPLRFATQTNRWYLGWPPSSPNYGLVMMVRVAPDISPLKPFGNNEDSWYSRLRTRFVAGYDNRRGIVAIGA
jgi:hypothetical protein